MDRGIWRATVHGVIKSQTRLRAPNAFTLTSMDKWHHITHVGLE